MNQTSRHLLPAFIVLCLVGPQAIAEQPADQHADTVAQEMITLPVRVVDPEGEPVVGVKVKPWALRCSQGHGGWRKDGFGESEPDTYTTDEQGRCEVLYPRFAKLAERVQTTQVTLSIDHPEFAYEMYEFINVPRKAAERDSGPHEVVLKRGAVVELAPLLDSKPASLENLYAIWSDGRSWEAQAEKTDNGRLRIPAMPLGQRQVLLVHLVGEHVTHFSPILDLQLEAGVDVQQSVELLPAVRIQGKLGDEVPRPIKEGRVKVEILHKAFDGDTNSSIEWFTWAPIDEEGNFFIDAWPAGEAMQLIALCDDEQGRSYMATSDKAPQEVEKPRDPATDPYNRAQVFRAQDFDEPIIVEMTPLVRCEIRTVDQQGDPIAGAEVASWPNVGWWNGGSQIYGTPLVRSDRMLFERDYRKAIDEPFWKPFHTTTDAQGRGTLYLPAGEENLAVLDHDQYELPINRGSRRVKVQLTQGEISKVTLKLQPKGTEYLGEWDKLAGVLFGCTGEECRRLMEDDGFRKRMESVRKLYDKSDDPSDPAMLGEIFSDIAAAFEELDEEDSDVEVKRWRRKAAEQAKKLGE